MVHDAWKQLITSTSIVYIVVYLEVLLLTPNLTDLTSFVY
jgi:hypothetical protein